MWMCAARSRRGDPARPQCTVASASPSYIFRARARNRPLGLRILYIGEDIHNDIHATVTPHAFSVHGRLTRPCRPGVSGRARRGLVFIPAAARRPLDDWHNGKNELTSLWPKIYGRLSLRLCAVRSRRRASSDLWRREHLWAHCGRRVQGRTRAVSVIDRTLSWACARCGRALLRQFCRRCCRGPLRRAAPPPWLSTRRSRR